MPLVRVAAVALLVLVPASAEAQSITVELDDPFGQGARQPVPAPPAYGGTPALDPELTQPTRPRRERASYMPTWPLLIPGLAAFVVSYGTAAFAGVVVLSSSSSTEEGTWLLVPVVGPFVLAERMSDPGDVALFVAMGIAETAGIALLVAGLALNSRAGEGEEDASASLVPLLGPDVIGLGATGRF